VTGANGFLGGALCVAASDIGMRVRALVRAPERGRFLDELPGVERVFGDCTDADQMSVVCDGVDLVVHCVAATSGRFETMQRTNQDGAGNVARAAGRADVDRLVYVSTLMVYGWLHDRDVFEEDGPAPSRDGYAITKSWGEAEVQRAGVEEGLRWCIVRPGAIYGPRSRSWTLEAFQRATRRRIFWPGDGQGPFPTIHVDDVVDLCLTALAHPRAEAEIFNAVNDPAPTVQEYHEAWCRLVKEPRWRFLPVPALHGLLRMVSGLLPRRGRYADLPDILLVLHRCARFRMTRARELLGWEPRIAFADGVRSCVPWLRERGLL